MTAAMCWHRVLNKTEVFLFTRGLLSSGTTDGSHVECHEKEEGYRSDYGGTSQLPLGDI